MHGRRKITAAAHFLQPSERLSSVEETPRRSAPSRQGNGRSVDAGACALLMSPLLRWLRTGAEDDEPAWRESLLLSQARKLEDMRKMRTILRMARSRLGDYYVDHQLPDTVP